MSTKNLYSPFLFFVVERLEIFTRQVEPWWEGAETFTEGGARTLGLQNQGQTLLHRYSELSYS